MRRKPLFPVLLTFALAGAASVAAATFAVEQIETRSVRAIDAALQSAGLDWVSVASDGLRIELSGTAPDEATRFRALGAAGSVVDGSRVIDRMEVVQADPVAAPRFSIEILRASEGVTVIGLVPASTDREALVERIESEVDGLPVTDLLEVASRDASARWSAAVTFGLVALAHSDKAKVSITAERVSVTTMARDSEHRAELERTLKRLAPDGVRATLDITAPRPVIAPFVLRLDRAPDGTSLVACSAAGEAGRDRILKAAEALAIEDPRCRIGLGSPSPDWAAAAADALGIMRQVEEGTLSLTNLEMRIEAGPDVANFGKIVADLESKLPPEFTLTAVQADEDAAADPGPAEFIATRSPEGLVQMRGRVGSDRAKEVVSSFGKALFGGARIDTSLEVSPAIPEKWSPHVLAALDALSILHNGAVTVRKDEIRITGISGNPEAGNDLAQLLSGRLGEEITYGIDVRYDERLDRELELPTPEECVERINAVLSERQITFDPGSSTIAPESRDSVEKIGEILRNCDGVRMEVGGHTDSQGGEEMNRELSQSRAEAVLTALLSRRIPVGDLSAVGYGETQPIADNATEAGRETNRRIEFRLIEDEADTAEADAEESGAAQAETAEGATAETDGSETPEAEPAAGEE